MNDQDSSAAERPLVDEKRLGSARPPGILSLRFKFLAFVSIAFVVSGITFGYVFSGQQESLMRLEFRKRGETLVRGMAATSRLDLWAGNRDRLGRLVAGVLEESNVIGASVTDATGEVLARAQRVEGVFAEPLPPQPPDAERIVIRWGTTVAGEPLQGFRAGVLLAREEESDIGFPEVAAPGGSQLVGTVEVVLGLGEVEKQISEVQRTVLRITAAIVGFGILSVIVLSRIFVTPIEKIAVTARQIAGGDLGARVEVRSRDEIGELASAFNSMTEALADREEELRRMNVGLEEKVRSRTAELEEKQRALLEVNVELERASRLKSEFLANMSHELRTPLNAVNGFSELLLERLHGPLTPKQQRYVENIHGSGRHLLQLINDILDLSKIEAGRMGVSPEEFSFRQVVDNAASVIQPLAQKKGLEVEIEVDPTIDRVCLDPGKTRQVLYNLLSNAVKFTDTGTISVSATPLDGSRFELVVADSGIGIAPEDQTRIFREFEQVDGSHSRRYEGTGLGLALTRKLVELQGGTIEVESEVGKGSRFIVRLPTSLTETT